MLRIHFGDMSDSIYNTEVFFKNTYEEEWFQDDFALEIVKKIDESEILVLLIRNCPDMVTIMTQPNATVLDKDWLRWKKESNTNR